MMHQLKFIRNINNVRWSDYMKKHYLLSVIIEEIDLGIF